MATKFYLRNLTDNLADTPSAEQSTTLPLGTDYSSGSTVRKDLASAAGSGTGIQMALFSSPASTAECSACHGIFASKRLAAQTLTGGQSWTVAVTGTESNTNANAFSRVVLYIWRPTGNGTGSVVKLIYDGTADLGSEFSTTSPTSPTSGTVATVTGAAGDFSVQANDVLVCEVWTHAATQGNATSRSIREFYDGSTDVTNGGTGGASYISVPQDLTFAAVDHSRTITDALGLTDSVARAIVRALTDALGKVDSIVRALVRPVTDALGLTDATTRAVQRALTDAESLTDTIDRALVRAVTDALGLTDARDVAVFVLHERVVTDALGATDALAQAAGLVRSPTDPLGLADAAPLVAAYQRNPVDALGLVDAEVAAAGWARSAVDDLGLTDPTQVTEDLIRVLVDAEGLADASSTTSAFVRVIVEALGLTDPRVVDLQSTVAAIVDLAGRFAQAVVLAGRRAATVDLAGRHEPSTDLGGRWEGD